jgi:hypothetical protein
MTKIFLGVPCYGNVVTVGCASSLFNATTLPLEIRFSDVSLLAMSFNILFLKAIENSATHFCLLHSDVEILTNHWIDRMLKIMKEKKLSVLSVVLPIKNDSGETSVALDNPIRKLTMKEIYSLPFTITRQCCNERFNNDLLLINTG